MTRNTNPSRPLPDEAIESVMRALSKMCDIEDGAYLIASVALMVESLGPAPAMDFCRAINAALLSGSSSAGVGKFTDGKQHIVVLASPGFDSVDDLKAKLDALHAYHVKAGTPIKTKSYADPDTN